MRQPTFPVALFALTSACAGGASPASPSALAHASTPSATAPGSAAVSQGLPPSLLKDLGAANLEARERRTWSLLLGQVIAPCSNQAVSLEQCIAESRPCKPCRHAARLLATKIGDGASPDQARQAVAARFTAPAVRVDTADSPTMGPATAPVVITVWSDFECPACRRAVPMLERSVARYSPNVRLIHKYYPLRIHVHGEEAARAAIAAQNQDKYWEMAHRLFEHQGQGTDSDREGFAKELGLDLARFRADLSSEATSNILRRDHDDGERAGLSATPFVLINGREFDTTYFHLDPDLDDWIQAEVDISGGRLPAP